MIALAPIANSVYRTIFSALCSWHCNSGVLQDEDDFNVWAAVSDVDVLVCFCFGPEATFDFELRFAFVSGGAVPWPAEVWGVGVLAFWDFVLDFF